jgi:hypothetical protein
MHERQYLSNNIEEIASANSLVRGLSDLGSLYSEVLPSAKLLHHFFVLERASASVSLTDFSSAAIPEARRPLSLRNRMTALYSTNVRNVQTRIDILETSAGADVGEAIKIVKKEIGQEKIVCRIQSFMITSARHWVRERRR